MKKKMKKIAIAFGIITCLAVLSMLLTSASAQEEEEEEERDWMGCPWGTVLSDEIRDPTIFRYARRVGGIGEEYTSTTVSTVGDFMGIRAEIRSGGSGLINYDELTITGDTNPDDSHLGITSRMSKSYATVNLSGTLGVFSRELSGMNCIKNDKVGAALSEKYSRTYEISGDFTHEGTGKYSTTSIDRNIHGKIAFAATVINPEMKHQTILRLREEHIGVYNITREFHTEIYP